MALSKSTKIKLVESYKSYVDGAKNIIIMKQFALPVNDINQLRMQISESGGKLLVVKKRIFLAEMIKEGFEQVELDKLEGSVIILYSYEDEFAPLKVVSKFKKLWKKEKKEFDLEYIGGWFDKAYKEAGYVAELADLPSKEELVGKFMYLLNYPLQSFVMVLNEIKNKNGGANVVVEESKQETVETVEVAQEVAVETAEPVAETTESAE